MKEFEGTIWTGEPNLKKMMKDRKEKNFLKIMVIILCILLSCCILLNKLN